VKKLKIRGNFVKEKMEKYGKVKNREKFCKNAN